MLTHINYPSPAFRLIFRTFATILNSFLWRTIQLIDEMEGIFELFLLAVALAMDCFTVSIVSGVLLRRRMWSAIVRTSIFFGLFQAAMPLAGWLGTRWFADYIEAYDHWIAFGLLLFLGIRMVRESMLPEEQHHFDPTCLKTQLMLAVATSIDALAVGISFACTGYRTLGSLALPLLLIGLVSLVFSVVGHLLGIRFGRAIARRLKPELFGGLILIAIGVRVLIKHTME